MDDIIGCANSLSKLNQTGFTEVQKTTFVKKKNGFFIFLLLNQFGLVQTG